MPRLLSFACFGGALRVRPALFASVMLALAVSGCTPSAPPCGAEGAVACGELEGIYTGSVEGPNGDARWSWSLEPDPCSLKGGIALGNTLVPLEGALCAGGQGAISASGPKSTVTGTLTFTPPSGSTPAQVAGELEVAFAGDNAVEAGTYAFTLAGARFSVEVPNQPCAVVCDDHNACTRDVCVVGPTFTCEHEQLPEGFGCDDGDLCTLLDTCSLGFCVGTPRLCNDDNLCTDDSCDPSSGLCQFEPNTAPCDDGNSCTVDDVCGEGVCGGTGTPSCCGNFTCEAGEDCDTCASDCAGVTTGPAGERYCCGNGSAEPAEGNGAICDGNY